MSIVSSLCEEMARTHSLVRPICCLCRVTVADLSMGQRHEVISAPCTRTSSCQRILLPEHAGEPAPHHHRPNHQASPIFIILRLKTAEKHMVYQDQGMIDDSTVWAPGTCPMRLALSGRNTSSRWEVVSLLHARRAFIRRDRWSGGESEAPSCSSLNCQPLDPYSNPIKLYEGYG